MNTIEKNPDVLFEEDSLGRITVYDPSPFADTPSYVIDPRLLPMTTEVRESGFSVQQDIAYQIAVAHYGYRNSRGAFWTHNDTETKRLRNKVFGIKPPTPTQIFNLVTGTVSESVRGWTNTRQNQKKKLKRRKAVLNKHR